MDFVTSTEVHSVHNVHSAPLHLYSRSHAAPAVLLLSLFAIACGESHKTRVSRMVWAARSCSRRVGRRGDAGAHLTEIIFAVGAGEKIVGTD